MGLLLGNTLLFTHTGGGRLSSAHPITYFLTVVLNRVCDKVGIYSKMQLVPKGKDVK